MTDVDLTDSRSLLGNAALPDDELAAIVRTAVDDPSAEITGWWVEPVDYPSGTPSTGALLHVRGEAVVAGGATRSWSVFVKVLRSPRLWPYLHAIPPQARQDFVDNFPWRLEIEARESGVDALLPAAFRLPRLYRVVEIDDDHAAMWMEDVQVSTEAWTVDHFARAAYALGRLAARRRSGEITGFHAAEIDAGPGAALRYYVQTRVEHMAVPMLGLDETWRDPMLAAAVDACDERALRADLLAAGARVTEWLSRLNELPQTYAHGDASPQNLLLPDAEPERFVVIDWGFDTPHAVGFDLGQLLVGLVHAGELPVADLPAVHDAILAAYVAGLAAEGMAVDPEHVRYGYVASMVLRSAFTALPLESLGAPPEDSAVMLEHWCTRVRLTRYLLDLAATLP